MVIMDNASIHNGDRVRGLIEGAGAKRIYTAPYSPDLNPIEFFFSIYKAGLQRHQPHQGIDWKMAHRMALSEVTPEKARNLFRRAGVPGCDRRDFNEDDFNIELSIASIVATTNQVASSVVRFEFHSKL